MSRRKCFTQSILEEISKILVDTNEGLKGIRISLDVDPLSSVMLTPC